MFLLGCYSTKTEIWHFYMIHLSFVYKGTVVQRHEYDEDYSEYMKHKIIDQVHNDEIKLPENWDRYLITGLRLPDWIG